MSTSHRESYHHGDLRAALLSAAMQLLAEGDETTLSLRAVARRAGVSPNAPYRHYPDKDALLAAMATQGYHDLRDALVAADAATEGRFVAMAQAYVSFGVHNPGLFRLMFGHPCSRSSPETSAAAAETISVLAERVGAVVPAAQHASFMVGAWSLVHGLAALVLDGKLDVEGQDALDELVRSTVVTMLGTQT